MKFEELNVQPILPLNNHLDSSLKDSKGTCTVKPVQMATLKKTKNCFSRPIIA